MTSLKKRRIIFWGTGAYANRVWREISELPFFNDEYVAFTDNNAELWGKEFHGLKIISPMELHDKNADILVITSIYHKEIKRQLVDQLGFAESRIYSFEEYKHICNTQWQYTARYGVGRSSEIGGEIFNKKNVVVYTAITGEYDTLKEPLFIDNDVTYICFTNNHKIQSDVWHIEYVQDDSLNNMYLAKKIKLHPHLYLKEFETSIWVDGKFEVRGDFRSYIAKYEREQPILCFPHYERSCIYSEAAACLYFLRGNKRDIIKQISDYYTMGYPFDNGLYEMGCIVRRHNDEIVKKIMGDWWEEVRNYSYRDQISFPVACWKADFLPDICDLDIVNNDWLKGYSHNA